MLNIFIPDLPLMLRKPTIPGFSNLRNPEHFRRCDFNFALTPGRAGLVAAACGFV
jgi:hypothetical protein